MKHGGFFFCQLLILWVEWAKICKVGMVSKSVVYRVRSVVDLKKRTKCCSCRAGFSVLTEAPTENDIKNKFWNKFNISAKKFNFIRKRRPF